MLESNAGQSCAKPQDLQIRMVTGRSNTRRQVLRPSALPVLRPHFGAHGAGAALEGASEDPSSARTVVRVVLVKRDHTRPAAGQQKKAPLSTASGTSELTERPCGRSQGAGAGWRGSG